MKFSLKHFLSKFKHNCRRHVVGSHLQKTFLTENLTFCAMEPSLYLFQKTCLLFWKKFSGFRFSLEGKVVISLEHELI